MHAVVVAIGLLALSALPSAISDGEICSRETSYHPTIGGSLDANEAVTLALNTGVGGILHLTIMETRSSLGVMNGGDGQGVLVVIMDEGSPTGSSSAAFDSGNAIYLSGGPVALTTASTTCSSYAIHEFDIAISGGEHELTIAHASNDGRTLAYRGEGRAATVGSETPFVYAVTGTRSGAEYFDHATVSCAQRAAAVTPSVVASALVGCEHAWAGSPRAHHAVMFQAPSDDAHSYEVSRDGESASFACEPAGCVLVGPSTQGLWELRVPWWIDTATSREEAGLRVPFFGLTFSR